MYFIEEEVRANLFFGHGLEPISGSQLDRGLRICRMLKLPERLMEYITSDEPTVRRGLTNNAAVLSRSDRAMLHIVRPVGPPARRAPSHVMKFCQHFRPNFANFGYIATDLCK